MGNYSSCIPAGYLTWYKGCEVIVSGKLRAQRAKSMKFRDGYMIKSGQPPKDFVDTAVRHVLLRQGVLGVKVAIMLPWDPSGQLGPKVPQPDVIKVYVAVVCSFEFTNL